MSVCAAALLLMGIGQSGADAPPVVHEQRLDDVTPVTIDGNSAELTVSHRGLAADSFAEVTNLGSGRTVILLVKADDRGDGILSAGAARALGLGTQAVANIRVRPAVPSPAEQAAVRSGSVVSRLDAPPALLAALRRRMPQPVPAATDAPLQVQPAPAGPVASRPHPAKPTPVVTGRWFVQVATLSDAGRARTLAKSVDGVVRSAGRLYRVQAGPFATRAAAETARASIARRGFGDARIIAQD
ncbi:SPOR domain-containing protein [Sphingomonas panni]